MSLSSLVSALVKWLPPIGMLRCQTRKPSVITRSVVSVPSESTTFDGGGLLASIVLQVAQLVEADEVVNRQRRELDDVDLDAGVFERLERPGHLVALHREQADFRLQRVAFVDAAARERLVVPDHVFERERNLLPRFVLDDVRNLLRFDRRQLDEPRQTALPGHRNRHAIAREHIPRDERLERFADELFAVRLRAA